MQPFGSFSPYYRSYSDLNPGLLGRLGEYETYSNPYLKAQLWNGSSAPYSPVTNPAAFSRSSPLHFSSSSPFGDYASQESMWSSREIDPATLWSRGVSSPCFRHDHHVIMRYSDPPFSAGNWEVDRRHMIEVRFDQFGVASHCRSTWGRMDPWRADRYRYSVEEANSKLQNEIMMLMSRLGMDSYDHLHQAGRDLGGFSPPWGNGNGYEYPTQISRCVQPEISPDYNLCRH